MPAIKQTLYPFVSGGFGECVVKIDLMVPALRVVQEDSGARVVNALDTGNVWRDLVDIPVDDLFSRLMEESRSSGTTVDVDTGDAWVRFTPQGRIIEVDAPPMIVEAERARLIAKRDHLEIVVSRLTNFE